MDVPFKVSPHLLEKFTQFLTETTGLKIPEDHYVEIEKKLPQLMKSLGFADSSECINWIMKAPLNKNLISLLAENFAIRETYFFRDTQSFQVIENEILPSIIKKHAENDRTINFWCAACATGEEAYTLAILLHRYISDFSKWKINIYATDINEEALDIARKGEYGRWSLRSIPSDIKSVYFNQKNDELWELNPQIRKMVEFEYLNLVEDQFLEGNRPKMDLILCHNVLIYFSQDQVQKTIDRLTNSLQDDGLLSVAAVEVPFVQNKALKPVIFGETTFFKKNGQFTDIPSLPLKTTLQNNLNVEEDFYEDNFNKKPKPRQKLIEQEKFSRGEKKQSILKSRAEKLSKVEKQELVREMINVIEFQLSTERYALETSYVKEVVIVKDYTPLPCVPAFIYGLMQVRRQIYPIIDLRALFDLTKNEAMPLRKVIILKSGEREFALLADEVYDLATISVTDIQPPLSTLTELQQEFLKGMTMNGLIILDGKRMIESKQLVVDSS